MQLELPGLYSRSTGTVQTAPVQHAIAQHHEAGNQTSGVGSTKGLTMELKVTGLANETDFKNPAEAVFQVVFNNGALRIQTTKEGADAIIKAMFSGDAEPYSSPPYEEDTDEDEDGVSPA